MRRIKLPRRLNNAKKDDLVKNTESPKGEFMTTNQGVRVNDDQNSLKAGERGPTLWKILSSAKKSPILIMSVFLKEWCMHEVARHMEFSRCINPWQNIQKQIF